MSTMQFKQQALLVSRLQQPWPQHSMHFHRRINDPPRQFGVLSILCVPLSPLWFVVRSAHGSSTLM